jgi:hypothetical protein
VNAKDRSWCDGSQLMKSLLDGFLGACDEAVGVRFIQLEL